MKLTIVINCNFERFLWPKQFIYIVKHFFYNKFDDTDVVKAQII